MQDKTVTVEQAISVLKKHYDDKVKENALKSVDAINDQMTHEERLETIYNLIQGEAYRELCLVGNYITNYSLKYSDAHGHAEQQFFREVTDKLVNKKLLNENAVEEFIEKTDWHDF